ncbi:hypothetical protein GCM10007880_58360 [Mesorhizobium amorphae]|nr:hypothetical protein GCM10007880_58360 [Mesorhizobium amorphae]
MKQINGPSLGFGTAAYTMEKCCFNNLVHKAVGRVERGSSRLRDVTDLAASWFSKGARTT